MNMHWLTLSPDTFLFLDQEKLLFYHAKNHRYLEAANNEFTRRLYHHLTVLDHLYHTELSQQELAEQSDLLEAIQNGGFGSCSFTTAAERPVSYMPFCKIHKGIHTIRHDYQERRAGYILDYLREVTIYLTGDPNGSATYYRQTLYPIKSDKAIAQDDIMRFMTQLKGASLWAVHILCNPQLLPAYGAFFQYLKQQPYPVYVYLLNSALQQMSVVPDLLDGVTLCVVSIGTEKPVQCKSYHYLYLASHKSELEHAMHYAAHADNAEVVPIYTGDNFDFFKDHVFTSKEELLSLALNKREIFARRLINTNFFGKLTLLPNSALYAQMHTPPLGSINDSLYEMIYKALDSSDSWMMTRDAKEPCSACRFKHLCPPISDYELAIGKNNLCTIWE